jgi:putative IMPACT (imprinted ancient) family translation regulator
MEPAAGALYKDRKSKFYAHIYRVSSIDEVDAALKEQRKKYKKARHHCWAYRIKGEASVIEKAHDDGEVGAPGKALLELMRGNEMENVLIIVSRIFGGVKLGMGGVRRAFVEAGKGAIEEFNRSP